ncbi:hypothetical protein HNQ50_001596 [Silvimonas terrae]|uniref:Uncharacterized protein n=1 Tax=Silvimonas terrae TaxID=300266 RepID=A0A840REV2_9NEIS|nr:hypothetical protein [Silvimonas terrae]MBB5190873.1 hypothetical protein [Silvimonas terrae]
MKSRTRIAFLPLMTVALMTVGMADLADAGPGVRGNARASVNHSGGGGGGAHNNGNGGNHSGNRTNINNSHNTVNNNNVNVNRDVNVNVENNNRHGYGYDDHYHPVATAAAVTATVAVTSAVVGAILTPSQMPTSGCVQVMRGNTAYMQCGSTWYQPQYQGSNVTYVVVNAP